ncbi:MAG: NAD-dependent epimerase [Desulfovibrionales bacterium]|nr:MAG: NAD-dependent epimerase [Desulfovibrionales bacterium]
MKILITGAAGFIGFHTVLRLLEQGHEVVGLDNVNDYYNVRVKYGRLAHSGITEADVAGNRMIQSTIHPGYRFVRMDLEDGKRVMDLFAREKFEQVMHYAAQAGVRYSLTNPHAYMQSNFVAFLNLLEACRHHPVNHFAYASSSSVYGLNEDMPFSVRHNVDHPISLYAASKKSNELMAHTYSYLYNIPTTGLRFFTVYGPWGRPDMALFLFTKAILEDRPIAVFNHGKMQRDFTYVDDIVEGVLRVIDHAPAGNPAWNGRSPDPSSSPAPWKVYNIGNSDKVELIQFIEALEDALGKKAQKNFLPLQPGDVPATWADTTDLEHDLGYRPNTPVQVGIQRFVEWYRDFFQV